MSDRAIVAAVIGAVIAGGFSLFAASLSQRNEPPSYTRPSVSTSSRPEPVEHTPAPEISRPLEPGLVSEKSPGADYPNPAQRGPRETGPRTMVEQRFGLTRIATFFEPALDRNSPAKLYIGFRNGSESPLLFRTRSVQLVIDGTPFRLPQHSVEWYRLEPTETLGPMIDVPNRGLVLKHGSVIEVRYEIDVKTPGHVEFERRYDVLHLNVLDFNPLRTQTIERSSESTFLAQ